jgi:hypothetical protein
MIMQGKFVFGGEGAKVPMTDFGVSFGIFKLWLGQPGGGFKGYTTASNQGLLGFAIIESPVVEFDQEDEEPFAELHGSTVEVTITPDIFVKDGGIATINVLKKTNDGTAPQFAFYSDSCKGGAASATDIRFTATLLELPQDEWNPAGYSYVPW